MCVRVGLAIDLLVDGIDDVSFVVEQFHEFKLAEVDQGLDVLGRDLFVPIDHAEGELVEPDAREPIAVVFELNDLLVPGVKQTVQLHVDKLPPDAFAVLLAVHHELLPLLQVPEYLLLPRLGPQSRVQLLHRS